MGRGTGAESLEDCPAVAAGGGAGDESDGEEIGQGAGAGIGTATFNVQVTPEPQTVALLGTGLLGLAVILTRRRAFAAQITN